MDSSNLPHDISLHGLQQLLQTSLPWCQLPAMEWRILLAHGLGLTRIGLITQDQRQITRDEAQQLTTLLKRRLQGEPIAYIVGEREFYGLTLLVSSAVLIPRPETELLVELGLQYAPPQARVLDLGTGSGAIAIALAHTRRDLHLTAVDASSAALEIAGKNVARHLPQRPFQLICSNWYQALPAQASFELIVANPPYIQAHDPHLAQGDLRFEPISALTDHQDGLHALQQIIQGAYQHLMPNAWLLLEHGYDQATIVRTMLQQAGFSATQSWCDLAGIERVSGGCRLA